jgi:hypothetical protein
MSCEEFRRSAQLVVICLKCTTKWSNRKEFTKDKMQTVFSAAIVKVVDQEKK